MIVWISCELGLEKKPHVVRYRGTARAVWNSILALISCEWLLSLVAVVRSMRNPDTTGDPSLSTLFIKRMAKMWQLSVCSVSVGVEPDMNRNEWYKCMAGYRLFVAEKGRRTVRLDSLAGRIKANHSPALCSNSLFANSV